MKTPAPILFAILLLFGCTTNSMIVDAPSDDGIKDGKITTEDTPNERETSKLAKLDNIYLKASKFDTIEAFAKWLANHDNISAIKYNRTQHLTSYPAKQSLSFILDGVKQHLFFVLKSEYKIELNNPESKSVSDFPKAGVEYIIKKGDTLSGIARKLDSNVSWITKANKIADTSEILLVGISIFVPQDK